MWSGEPFKVADGHLYPAHGFSLCQTRPAFWHETLLPYLSSGWQREVLGGAPESYGGAADFEGWRDGCQYPPGLKLDERLGLIL